MDTNKRDETVNDPAKKRAIIDPTNKRAQTIIDVAETYSLSRAMIYRAISEGWGPTVTKVGSRSIILREDVEKFAQVLKERWQRKPDTVRLGAQFNSSDK